MPRKNSFGLAMKYPIWIICIVILLIVLIGIIYYFFFSKRNTYAKPINSEADSIQHLVDNPDVAASVITNSNCEAASVRYLFDNPDVAADPFYGKKPVGPMNHYVDHGKSEGRVWRSDLCDYTGFF
jgi:hypothetical protein